MYEHIPFKYSHYKVWSFSNVMHLHEIHLIISSLADNAAKRSSLKIKSHNINSFCVRHNVELFKHISTSLSKFSGKMLCVVAVCNIFMTTGINLVCLFCCFTSQVNSYGHGGTVSSPNHTFSWASLNKQLTCTLCTYFRL